MSAKKLKTETVMRIYHLIGWLFVASACSSDEPLTGSHDCTKTAEIECNTESEASPMSRTYYEGGASSNVYRAKWDKDDQIAMCFDGAGTARQFNLLYGENNSNAVFYGPVPDTYSRITAVYPFDIFRERTSGSIDVCLPASINYNADKILCGAMPMYAHGSKGVLNFYNLMGVMKISVRGNGLLRSISVSSPDGIGLSGNGHITLDSDGIPRLTMEDNANSIAVNIGALLLSTNPEEIFLPVPATTYENGLKLEFVFEGKTETRVLAGALHFERSVMRAVKPYEIDVPFDFDNYQPRDNEIWYKASPNYPHTITDESELSVISNSYSDILRLGVIATESAIKKIGGPIFTHPVSVTFIKLPDTIEEIAMYGLKRMSIEKIETPKSLRTLGTDALIGCKQLKEVTLNDGLESLGLEVFGDCPNLESVYIPKTVQVIGAYSFLKSTEKLDHWDGDCALIDPDRHALYSNSMYGMVAETPTQIDVIAGCNLTEYKIPEQALYVQNYAFHGCKKLKKLIIHENFKSFGLDLFSSLPQLETIDCYAETPPEFNSDENFESTYIKQVKQIRVPANCVDKYKKADGWRYFSHKIVPL